jgi:radical SAM protein with 4Fe4S-binding SPASM domain
MTAFDRAPFIAIWETTRACPLACVHCRAEARTSRGLSVSLTPSAAPHDAFRRVRGSHRHTLTLRILERARTLGIPFQLTDGNGFLFVDHLGTICPSVFLPIETGNVRTDDLVVIYRDHPLFRDLRDRERLRGRCGACEFRERCGGRRARAWAATGDPLGEDPGCTWQPAARSARPVPAIAGGSDAATAVTPEQVTQALREVFDPELGMSIVELGLVYGIDVRGGAVTVTMTLTAPGCPIHDVMPQWVTEAIRKLPGVERVDVAITFDPPWTPNRIARV